MSRRRRRCDQRNTGLQLRRFPRIIFKTECRNVQPGRFRSEVKISLAFSLLSIKFFSHAGMLCTLPREYKCNFAHLLCLFQKFFCLIHDLFDHLTASLFLFHQTCTLTCHNGSSCHISLHNCLTHVPSVISSSSSNEAPSFSSFRYSLVI